MPPDLNSLPPSRSTSASPIQSRSFPPVPSADPSVREAASPRSASISLQAAATINAADLSRHSSGSPRLGNAHERRRSAVAMNLNLNDPTMPSPGELASSDHRASIGSSYRTSSPSNIGRNSVVALGDPHHHQRNPSLGEIHQELENEQEAQVNRLLQQIRLQQAQLQQLQMTHQQYVHAHVNSTSSPLASSTNIAHPSFSQSSTAIDDSTPTSEAGPILGGPFPSATAGSLAHASSSSSAIPTRQVSHRHRRSSQSPSPALHPVPRPSLSFLQHLDSSSGVVSSASTSDFPSPIDNPAGSTSSILPHQSPVRRTSRDETAYYQAETANLTRENQMLRHRIRELERQLNGENGNAATDRARRSSTSIATPSTLMMTSSSSSSAGNNHVTPMPGGAGGSEASANSPIIPSHLSQEVLSSSDSKTSAAAAASSGGGAGSAETPLKTAAI